MKEKIQEIVKRDCESVLKKTGYIMEFENLSGFEEFVIDVYLLGCAYAKKRCEQE